MAPKHKQISNLCCLSYAQRLNNNAEHLFRYPYAGSFSADGP